MKGFTHFLNIPIKNFNSFNNKFNDFKRKVNLIDSDYSKYFYNFHPHLTLAVLSIPEEKENLVKKLFFKNEKNIQKLINKKILKKDGKFIFDIPIGLDGFYNKSKKDTKVIFCKINDFQIINNFNEINNFILQKLINKEIIDIKKVPNIFFNEKNNLYEINKFHITLMKSPKSFDGCKIFDNLNSFNFGKFQFEKISLKKLNRNQTEVAYINL